MLTQDFYKSTYISWLKTIFQQMSTIVNNKKLKYCFLELFSIFFSQLFSLFLAAWYGLWDLSLLTRD